MQHADVYVGKTIYQAVIRKLLSSCCNCCFKKKPTEQPDPRLNWTIIDVEARFVLLYYYITFPHLIIIFQLTMIYVIILTDPQQSNKVDQQDFGNIWSPNPSLKPTLFIHFQPFHPPQSTSIHLNPLQSTSIHLNPLAPTQESGRADPSPRLRATSKTLL